MEIQFPKSECWTDSQKQEVDRWVRQTADAIYADINARQVAITAMDDRPHQIWREKQPNVFFPYAAQAMLEDLIAELTGHV